MEIVEDVSGNSLTTPSLENARQEIKRVPGGAMVIDSDDYKERYVGSLSDTLQLSPGVFTQSRFGASESRLSIRGSGITQTFGIRGVRFLRDGLPVSTPGGFTNPELIEPLNARYVEVFRGANALKYGSAMLGGAVNFVSRTGRNSPGFTFQSMFGEHDYVRPQMTLGGVINEDFDYFLSASSLYQDGFRDQSRELDGRGYANFGYRWSDSAETRIHFNAHSTEMELPGSLTRAQFDQDPSKANGFWESRNAQRDLDILRTDIQHTITFNETDRLDIGAYYEHRELDHPLPFVFIGQENNETGLSFRYSQNNDLFGHENSFVIGGLVYWGEMDGTNHVTLTDARQGNLLRINHGESSTSELYAENQFSLTDNVKLVTGAQFVHARRRVVVNNVNAPDSKNTKDYTGFNPKLGVIWDVDENVQLFANASRSYEPPTDNEFNNGFIVNDTTRELDAQDGTTLEVGTRGNMGLINWDLAAYHSWLQDEILTQGEFINGQPTGRSAVENANHTDHSGVELGLSSDIPLGVFGDDKLAIKGVYTYNRFRFDGDKSFGDNELPGIPTHVANLELIYKHPLGFYAGPNIQYASDYYVDYANTLKAPSYVIMGARGGYDTGKGVKLFVDARNLLDKDWVSNTGLTTNANGGDAGVFNPGYDLSFFGGFSVEFN
ncbi:TonB-dependent receptor [Methylomarinum sp. Ch1-1]|uniref:TonB-dependent receptor n=1 Tax=Methylomarinum roseum TaxID=3067653 RepID=A0AAU7NRF0_9GAMM|nr:TonB-dependent receptor [Methylomarinum sp. Ch1-1]MDP4520470.1 TonB-dependent receptor [Methylomarinum sp. Ch1-1]